MSSGKQLSFAFGEISPELLYNADAVPFGSGLYRLRNAYVRKNGGVSNRAGFRYLAQHPYQGQIRSAGSTQALRILTAKSYDLDTYESLGTKNVFSWVFDPSDDKRLLHILRSNGTLIHTIDSAVLNNSKGTAQEFDLVVDGLNTLISFGRATADVYPLQVVFSPGISGYIDGQISGPYPEGSAGAISATLTTSGLEPLVTSPIPVSYMVTQELKSGVEVLFISRSYAAGHPHAQAHAQFTFDIVNDPNIVAYKIYRASGSINSNWSFVGKLPLVDKTATTMTFQDFGVTGDPLHNPPLTARLWGKNPLVNEWYLPHTLLSAKRFAMYQQRLALCYDTEFDDSFEEGTIGVSKAGSPYMLHMPPVFRDIEAFEFRVPTPLGSPIVNYLSMERLIVLTEEAAYIIMGNEAGILTPSTINPVVISNEGGSKTVTPKVSGTNGYYLTKNHKKLMRVSFGAQGNFSLDEVSQYSSGLFEEEDILQMEITRGSSDNVWLLRRDGKLLLASMKDDAVGFSLVETDGFIESICSIDQAPLYARYGIFQNTPDWPFLSKRPEDSLIATIVRDGVRYIEALAPRSDEDPEGMFFADSFVTFGKRLVKSSNFSGYFYVTHPLGEVDLVTKCDVYTQQNLTTATDWNPGSPITMTNVSIAFTLTVGDRVHWYYDLLDDKGKVIGSDYIRFTVTAVDTSGAPATVTATLISDEEVPESLRDVENNADLTAEEKYNRQTRWVVATKELTGLTHLAGKEVSVFADNRVLSSPNNPNIAETMVVENDGTLDLGDYYSYGYVGLPYTSEIQTLAVEASDNRTLSDANKVINEVGVALRRTRGMFAGSSGGGEDIEDLTPLDEQLDLAYEDQLKMLEGVYTVSTNSGWDKFGRAIIKQVDPLPLTVLAVYPKGLASG